MGDILIESGAISKEQMQEALVVQKRTNKRISQIMLEEGFITEEKLAEILEQQLGIPQVNLYNYQIDPEAVTSIPFHLAQRYQVVPLGMRDQRLILAMADPMNIIALDDVAMVTGKEVDPVIASASAINSVINQFFGLKESLQTNSKPEIAGEDEVVARLKALVEDAPIVKVVNSLIQQAVNEGASDIHIEPSGQGMRIRLRIDGILYDLMQPPKDTQPLIVSRIKIMAGLDIAERRLPQDGQIQIQAGLKDINLRVSTLPTIHGEKVVIRLLEKERIILPLDKLGLSARNYRVFMQLLMNHAGIILVTGPTGSGKTTTLYSALNYLNRPEDNIITIEDPVEYRLDGINQIQVNPRINLTFANALRAILRQDPNIIMIGEIRDRETAEMATRAALTGHLVLSTLHTNDAVRAVSRLVDMGVENYLITSSLIGVMAQRLIRIICTSCREKYVPATEEQLLYTRVFGEDPPAELHRGTGCKNCNQTGYRGRMAIHEVLPVNQEVRRLILQEASSDVLEALVLEQGMETMLVNGRARILEGVTSLEEVVRAAFSSAEFETRNEDSKPGVAPEDSSPLALLKSYDKAGLVQA